MREALFALAAMERELVDATSRLPDVMEEAMLSAPSSWKPYYGGDAQEQKRLRVYSYSDRMRYYWNDPRVQAAVARLIENLSRLQLPETMLSAYLPQQYERVREGSLKNKPESLIVNKVRDVLRVYAAAC
jgi:D-tagatose-1,6-bisphosphate aldolase subunit GatZ/KbaZ